MSADRLQSDVTNGVDIIVPVYGNPAAVSRCLDSLLATRCEPMCRVLVIDDASPDRQTRDYLQSLAETGEIELIRHAHNKGFVCAVNTGIAASSRDVVLLNSDTEVHGDWVARMSRCAGLVERVATVTPFCSNATICTYPWQGWSGGIPGGLSLAELDTIFSVANHGRYAELPTGVGCCLYVSRASITAIGHFDEEAFGRGYGEENDFCQRAAAVGWKNLLCADTFIFHEGGASFGLERDVRVENAERILAQRYPSYQSQVRDFILADILAPFRLEVDVHRVTRSAEQAREVLAERLAEKAWFIGWLAHLVRELDGRTLPPKHSVSKVAKVKSLRRKLSALSRLVTGSRIGE